MFICESVQDVVCQKLLRQLSLTMQTYVTFANNLISKVNEVDWKDRKLTLDKIIEENRGKFEYDCIIPFSGGKDSTFTLYYLIKEYSLKPLVVQFNHGFMRPNLLKNNERTFKSLGVDVCLSLLIGR